MNRLNDGEENVKKLSDLCEEFAADRDSLLGIYACGKSNGGYYVVGEAWKFIEACGLFKVRMARTWLNS